MVYVTKKSISGKDYFYLVSNIKRMGKIKKVQIYAGSSKPAGKKLRGLKDVMELKLRKHLTDSDPLLGLNSQNDRNVIEKSKLFYSKISNFSPSVKRNYYEWFVSTITYNSNAIEGSSLSLRETSMVIFEGITPTGKSIEDVRAAENHKRAFDFILSYRGDIDKRFVLKMHKILAKDLLEPEESGKLRKVQVYVRGSGTIPPKPEEVPVQLKQLIGWCKNNKKRYDPAVLASYFHTAFEGIHPFVDFNGRTGRLLLNFILIKNGCPPIDIRNSDRLRYYGCIRSGIKGNVKPMCEMIIDCLKDILKNSTKNSKS